MKKLMLSGLVGCFVASAAVVAQEEEAQKILTEAGITGGLVVHVGCGDGKLTAALRANDTLVVHGLDTDAGKVVAARKYIQEKGLYAPITVFDAATGKIIKKYDGTERTQELVYDNGVLFVVIGDPVDTSSLGGGKYTLGSTAFPEEAYSPKIPKLQDPKSTIVAIEADSGQELWKKEGDDTRAYLGASLAVRGTNAVYSTRDSLVCLDRNSGAERWRVGLEKASGQTPTRDKGGAKKGGRGGGKGEDVLKPQARRNSVTLVLSDEAVYLATGSSLRAFAIKDGAELWSVGTRMNHHKPPGIFLTGGAVWTANNRAYDPLTGRPIKTLSQKMTGPMGHDRCYQNRLTERWYINTVSGGSDFLAMDGSGEFPTPWGRSTCGVGHLPCNGLLYLGPPACSCNNMVQLNSLNALATEPSLKSSGQPIPVQVKPREEKGPAYARESGGRSQRAERGKDWPTYRHDLTRGGCTKAVVPAAIEPKWQTKLTTRVTAPVIADGKVFVADVDAHVVCALGADDGKLLWTYTTGGRVDSPPTYYRGRLLFGSHDGWVYCVQAADGELVWRFKALPDKMICAYEQMESPWPVSGSILIKNDVAYFAAGRNTFLDGGIFLFGLDPQTGGVVHQRRLYGPYGENGFPLIASKDARGFGLWGNKGDVLLADDQFVYMRHQAFGADLTPVDYTELSEPHLITSHAFTVGTPHHRSFWTIDMLLRYDIATSSTPVQGDILVWDGARYYEVRGYPPGRYTTYNARENAYTLFAGEIPDGGERGKGMGVTSRTRWQVKIPLTGKAMVLADEVLFLAGTPVAFPKDDLAKAYEGRMGGVLWAASAEDGKKLAEYKLDAAPVWDSLAAVNGRLFICTTDGRVRCFSEEN